MKMIRLIVYQYESTTGDITEGIDLTARNSTGIDGKILEAVRRWKL